MCERFGMGVVNDKCANEGIPAAILPQADPGFRSVGDEVKKADAPCLLHEYIDIVADCERTRLPGATRVFRVVGSWLNMNS
jgi:hypothetical protein